MIRQSAPSMAFAVAVLLAGSWPSGLRAEAVILEPGWMAGQVDVATDGYKVQSLSVNAYGGGYQSQKSVSQSYTGEPAPLDYSMTVQGGDWDYTVNATATARPSPDYCPAGAPYCYQAYTNIYFSPRYFPVGVGETVANDYMATGTVQFQLTVTDASDLARGNSITSWYAQGYAVKSLPAGEEGTNSRSYTRSNYTPCGIWDMPVVGNSGVRVYAYVTVYGTALRDDLTPYSYSQSYSLYTSSNDLLEVDVGTDETNRVVVVPLEIEHVAPPPPDDPQAYDLGAVRGTVDLGLVVDGVDYSDQLGFGNYPTWPYAYHYVSGWGGTPIYTNPGDYLINSVREGTYTYSARSYLWDDDRSLYLYWPYTGGDSLNDQVTIAKDQVSVKDFANVTGILTGNVQLTGALKKSDSLEYYTLYTYGACDYYVGGARERQPTCGGYSYDTVYATDADKSYRLFLPPGPWHPYYLRVRANNTGVLGYSGWSDMTLYDYNHYFNGDDGYYNFGRPTEVEPGVSTHENRNYKTGGVSMCFQTAGAGSLRSPSVYGYAYQYNQEGRQEMYVYVSGGSSPDPNTVPNPEVMVYGPEGDYSLTPRAYTEDDTYITFPARQVTLTEKVYKRRCLTSPDLTIENYVFEASTTAETGTATVTISGTAADEDGVLRIAFFLDDILMHVIDNSATAQAFFLAQTDVTSGLLPTSMDFSYDLEVPAGTHTIGVVVTDGAGEESSDEWEIVVNTAPTANADGYTTNEDVALVRSAPGLLANDTDADGDTISVASATQPSHGTLTWSADGAVSYVPNANYNGPDGFTYSITDGKGGADSATVAINVLPVNDPPAASGEDYSTPEDTALVVAAPGLLANDEDIDGDALTASLASAPAHGMVTVSADGSFTYTPSADYFGADSFTYTASDGNGGSDTATVSITVTPVNDSPVLSVEIASQPVQYSDGIAPVTISALDIDSAPAALVNIKKK